MSDLQARLAALSPRQREQLLARLAATRRERTYPLSSMQRRLWFLERLTPGTAAYVVPAALRLRGVLDEAVLRRAVQTLVSRHEALRTTFAERDGEPVQVVAPHLEVLVRRDDLRSLPPAERAAVAAELVADECALTFDLERGPLLRLRLVRTADDEHVLVVVLHHLVADGWSVALLVEEFVALYDAFAHGRPDPLPGPPLQYGQVALRERTGDERIAADLRYWAGRLADVPVLALPTDRPRPPVRGFRGASAPVELPPDVTTALTAVGQRCGATPFMVVLALYVVLLHRRSLQDDVVVGIPVANRDSADLVGVVGFFVNTLAIRVDLSGEPTFDEVVARVRESCLAAYEHQEVPFDRVVEELRPPRDLSRPPVCQVSLAYQPQPIPSVTTGGLELSRDTVPAVTARFDLELQLVEQDGGLVGTVEYDRDLFDPAGVERLVGQLRLLADGLAAAPDVPVGTVPMLGEDERLSLLALGAGPHRPWPPAEPVPVRVERTAARVPHAEAVRCGDVTLTYAELVDHARVLARHLRAAGVGRDVVVGLHLEPSVETLVAVLGVHLAGGAYLPLDPDYPAARVAYVLEDSGAPVVVTTRAGAARLGPGAATVLLVDDLPPVPDAEVPCDPVDPDALAYVIYTSGSTGRPKGVQVPHGALANFARSMQLRPGVGPDDVVLALTSISFDISVLELLVPLTVGARVVVVPREVAADGQELATLVARSGATLVQATPATWTMLLDAGWKGVPGLRMLCGGEALTRRLADRLLTCGAALWNMYGPTETTVWSSVWCVGAGAIDLGEPVAETLLLVLDRYGALVPVGVPGELHIGGAGLARGYLGRPDLTAERFVRHDLATHDGRLYRTGDLVRRRCDGSLEYLGRLDHQVKLRGFRIELGEIEQTLLTHDDVRAAVVVAADAPGGTRLVAYVVTDDGAPVPELLDTAREQLPAHMLPSLVVPLERLPLTPNGKVDRAALPRPDLGREALATAYAAPRDDLEEAVAAAVAELVGSDRVGRDDDFFALGGHSLLATRLAVRLRALTGVELPLRALFEQPTVAAMAAALRTRGSGDAAAAARPATIVPRRADPRAPSPLTPAQRRLWFLEQLQPGDLAYVLPAAVRLRGPLDVDVLRRACDLVVSRHEALRTVLPEVDGSPRQVVLPEARASWEVRDVPVEATAEQAAAFLAAPFDLAAGPVMRVLVLRHDPLEATVLVAVHHAVADQWSLGVLLGEVLTGYDALRSGVAAPLAPLAVQYGDYAQWLAQDAQGLDDAAARVARRLTGAPPVLDLSLARPRGAERTGRGGTVPVHVPAADVARLERVAQGADATLFMVLLAALQVVLARLGGTRDVVVGTPVANRPAPELEDLVGLFVNTVPVRTDLSGDPTFTELLTRVRQACLDAWEDQHVPFERVVEAVNPPRSLARTPVFQVGLALQNVPFPGWSGGGLDAEPLPVDVGAAKFDLELLLTPTPDGLDGRLEFSADLYDARTAGEVWRCVRQVLAAVTADPDATVETVPLLDDAALAEVLVLGEGPRRTWPPRGLVHERVAQQAARTPDAPAVRFDGAAVTYADLDARANRLAHRLRSLGVGRDVVVGVCQERGVALVVSLLAVLKAGGAYLPLDPSLPEARLRLVLDDARPRVVLVHGTTEGRLPATGAHVLTVEDDPCREQPATPPDVVVDGEDAAYVIYTSGSTGRPKGVVNVHAAISNRLLWMQEELAIDATDRVLQKTPFSFDVSVWEFFWPLMQGACLVVALPGRHRDSRYLVDTIRTERITTVHFVPSMLHAFLLEDDVELCTGLRRVVCSGEALPRELQDRFFARCGAQLHNLYGPTEAAVDVTAWRCRPDDPPGPVPIGRAIANTSTFVLDDRLAPVPRGAAGELCLGGRNLARGYLGRPDLTAERFVPHPFDATPGARVYRTGDLVRYRHDGALEFLGRLDHQVKLRGLRIELGEIEHALRAVPGVDDAVVTVTGNDLHRRLVAHVAGADVPGAADLAARLGRELPDYMVPGVVVPLPVLPVTANGKVDRAALPDPDPARPALATPYRAPDGPLERTVAAAWRAVLDVERVGVDDSFFDLGGHSLLLAELRVRLEHDLGRAFSLVELFQFPTVRTFAAHVSGEQDAGPTTAQDRARSRREAQASRRHATTTRLRAHDETVRDQP